MNKIQDYKIQAIKIHNIGSLKKILHALLTNFFFQTTTILNTFTQDRAECKMLIYIIEPWHGISNNVVCATSKVSDQPAHRGSLIRAFASCLIIL